MTNNDVFSSVQFCGFTPDGVEVERTSTAEFVTIKAGHHTMTLSGEFGLARQLIEKLEQELKKADNELIAKYCKEAA